MNNRREGFKGNQEQRGGYGKPRRDSFRDDQGPREMHKAVCSDCKNECEVPFKPSTEKPVYCRDCYRKHKKF